MKRVTDAPYYTYSVYTAAVSGIRVKCPRCGGLGIVTADESHASFICTSCGTSKKKSRTSYRYDVHNLCEGCGRYYRVDIRDEKQQHSKMLHVACPHCGFRMPGEVHRTAQAAYYCGEIRNGCEPYFGYELWFLASFDNKPVWAINREHLAYLIDYLSADLREKPTGSGVLKTQSDQLPTFMKTSKNRARIVKLLEDLQKK